MSNTLSSESKRYASAAKDLHRQVWPAARLFVTAWSPECYISRSS